MMRDLRGSSSAPGGAVKLIWQGAVPAAEPWFAPPVALEEGTRYYFRASGTWQDASITCDANGHDAARLRWVRFLMRAKGDGITWFTLIGAIDRDASSFFAIGDGTRWPLGAIAAKSGQLFCFANDAPLMYWNNHGAVTLQVWC